MGKTDVRKGNIKIHLIHSYKENNLSKRLKRRNLYGIYGDR